MQKRYDITTPIYYVNDKPHIGHAYTTLACDVLARFKRLDDYDVLFLTGTDEHGQKVQMAADKAGVSPKEFTDNISGNFRALTEQMNFSNDYFIRTTEPRHYESCQKIWNILMEKGHIFLSAYSGWYSVRDEAFFAESESLISLTTLCNFLISFLSLTIFFNKLVLPKFVFKSLILNSLSFLKIFLTLFTS